LCFCCLSPHHSVSSCKGLVRCLHCFQAGHILRECRAEALPLKAILPPHCLHTIPHRLRPPPSSRSPILKTCPVAHIPVSQRLSHPAHHS
jgi:hypothetical protein